MAYTVVKCSLNRFCKNEFLQSRINDIVLNCNRIMFEAYCFANLHVLRLLDENKEVPKLDQTFFNRCCCYVSCLNKRKEISKVDEEMNVTFDLYAKQRPPGFKVAYRDSIRAVLAYIAVDMVVSTTNHLALNFYKRFSTYLKHRFEISSEQCYKVCKAIYEKEYDGEDAMILEYRRKLGSMPPYESNIKKGPSYVLQVYHEILEYNKSTQNNQDLKTREKLFSLLPHKGGFQMSYITIDNRCLQDLLIAGNIIKKCEQFSTKTALEKDFKSNTRRYWDMFFDISAFESRNRTFANMFKTDGKTVSIVLNVPERVEKPSKTLSIDDYDSIVALDPGYRYMYVGKNNDDDYVWCSGKRYYHDSGVNTKNRKQKSCYSKNRVFADYMSNMPSPKTHVIDELLSYIKYSLAGLDDAFRVHFDNPFRKWRFTTYIKKQIVFVDLCKDITKKRHKLDNSVTSIVGFGNWSNSRDSIIRGHRRGPVKEIKRELSKWCKVIDVDEFRTSKLCCHCHSETGKVSFNGHKVHSVLRCTNNECGITIDRDVNGANNIYMLFERMLRGRSRPKAFRR